MQSVRHAARQILGMMHGGNDRHSALHQTLQQALHRGSLDGIEACEGFVQQQYLRIRRHRSRDERASQLSVGQFARPALRDIPQFEKCEPALARVFRSAAVIGAARPMLE